MFSTLFNINILIHRNVPYFCQDVFKAVCCNCDMCWKVGVKHWLSFVSVFGEKVHQRIIVNRCFNTWLESFRFQQVLFDRQARMEELRETFQKRRVFLHWRHCILLHLNSLINRGLDQEKYSVLFPPVYLLWLNKPYVVGTQKNILLSPHIIGFECQIRVLEFQILT